MNESRSIPIIWIPLLLVALACESGDPVETVVRDSAGVEIVENPSVDRMLPLDVAEIASLVPPDSALTPVPWGVAAEPTSGKIFVADWAGFRVAVFDQTGSFVDNYGREGEGPGEFQSPSAVAVDGSGSLAVWDTGRRIISRWSSEGELLSEQRPEVAYWGPGFAITPNRMIAVTSESAPDGTGLHQRLVSWSSGDVRTIYTLTLEQDVMELPCIAMPAPKVFAPSVQWRSQGEAVYVLKNPDYQIDVYKDEVLVRSIRRAVQPIVVTDEMAAERVRTGPYADFMQVCGVTADAVVRAAGHERAIAPVLDIAVDPLGRLWVTRTSDGMQAEAVDVLSPNGEYLGTVTGAGMPVTFLADSLMVSLHEQETGERTASLHKIPGSLP